MPIFHQKARENRYINGGTKHTRSSKTSVVYHKVARVSLADPTPRLSCNIVPTSGSKPGTPFEFDVLPDTGATISVIASDIARRYGLRRRDSTEKLLAADNSTLKVLGCTRIKINGVQIRALITDAFSNEILLSWRDMVRLHIIAEDFPQPMANQVARCIAITKEEEAAIDTLKKEILEEFPDVLQDTLPDKPMFGPRMTITLNNDSNMKPRCTTTCRPIPFHMEEAADRCIESLLKQGVIEKVPVNEVSRWISPAFFVPKNGTTDVLSLIHI